MARKYPSLDVLQMKATLTVEHWQFCLRQAVKNNSVEKLMAWRYGLQAGLAEAVNRGIRSDELDLWVLKRIKNVEQAIKYVVRKRNPNICDKDPRANPYDYIKKAKEAKRRRDKELEQFLLKSNF